MGIVRNDPFKNLDTDQPLDPSRHVTRSTLHRILKRYGIQHDPRLPARGMMDLMEINNIPFDPPPPGPVTDPQGKIVDISEPKQTVDWAQDGYPKHIGKVKKMCTERKIKFRRNAKRATLVKKLNDYMESLNG